MKKVLCVIRESTLRQEVESQKMDMLPFLKSKGFNENQIVWMEVQGASAIKANDVYLNYLDDIKERSMEIGCVAFWHLNRLGRQKKYITMMEAFFKSNKIQVYIKNPDITLLDNEGKEKFEASLAFSIFAVMVESETEEMLGKFKRGKELNKREGRYNGGAVPLGFRVEDRRVVVDPKTAPIIKSLYKMYINRMTIQFIYEWLMGNGHKVAKVTIHKMIKNAIYKQIVDEETWDKAQQLMVENTKRGKFTKKHYASNLIKCPICGRNYTLRNERSWVCCGHTEMYKGTDNFCGNNLSMNSSHLDFILVSYALYRVYNTLNGQSLVNDIEKQCEYHKHQISKRNEERKKIEARKERMAISFENGAYSKEIYLKRLAAANKEIDILNFQIRDLKVQMELLKENATPKVEVERMEDLIELLSYGDIYMNIHKYIKVGYVYPIDNGRLLKLQNIDDEDINIAFLGKGRGVKILKNISPHKDGVYDITDWTDITKYYRDKDVEMLGKVLNKKGG